MTGPCDRCGATPAPVLTYFGPELCHACARAAADYFDREGRWPTLPADWQAELDALGPWPLDHVQPLHLVVPDLTRPPGAPEPCPPDVHLDADHLWVCCSECGQGCVVSLTNPNGKRRKVWPTCRMTQGCPGRHTPHHQHDQQQEAS